MQEIDPRQLDLFRSRTIRARVLDVVIHTDRLLTAKEVAELARVTYAQAVFALFALHNAEKIHRQGKKTTALWGNLTFKPQEPQTGYELLERIFHGFAKR